MNSSLSFPLIFMDHLLVTATAWSTPLDPVVDRNSGEKLWQYRTDMPVPWLALRCDDCDVGTLWEYPNQRVVTATSLKSNDRSSVAMSNSTSF